MRAPKTLLMIRCLATSCTLAAVVTPYNSIVRMRKAVPNGVTYNLLVRAPMVNTAITAQTTAVSGWVRVRLSTKSTSNLPAIVEMARPTPRQPVISWTGLITSSVAVAIHPG